MWILLLALLAIPAPQSEGVIQGTVVRSGTSEPVPGVRITLAPQATPAQTDAFRNASANRGRAPKEFLWLAHDGKTVLQKELGVDPILTDNAGHFAIRNVPEGSYAVSAARDGYFGRGSDPETPGILDGAAMSDMVLVTVVGGGSTAIALELTPSSAISGRVTDQREMPLADQHVQAFRAHRQGNETRLSEVRAVMTDDRGQYRLHTLPAGEYFIAAGPGLQEYVAPEAPGTAMPLLTFHPSTMDPQTSPPLVLKGGEDLSNKDIRVRSVPIVRISGYALNRSGNRNAASASIQLVPGKGTWIISSAFDDGRVIAGASATFTDPDRGSFEFHGIFSPGLYELRAVIDLQNRRQATGNTPITIGSQNLDGVLIVVGDAADVAQKP